MAGLLGRVTKWVTILFGVRAASSVLRALLPFDHPHAWRQFDTLGVAMRYWLRWTVEPVAGHPLLPAVLNSGDGYGLMAMEFPLLNLLTAPAFSLGPEAGRFAALLCLFSLHFLLTWATHLRWKDRKILGRPAGPAFLLLAWVGISGTYIQKFMPDYLAMILVLWGVSFLWDDPGKRRERGIGAIAVSLGLLAKPTAVTVLALLLLREGRGWRRYLLRLVWIVPALIVAGLYYTVGMKFLQGLQDTRGLFRVEARDPLASFLAFFSSPGRIFELVFGGIAFWGAPLFALAVLPFADRSEKKRFVALGGILSLQILAIALLDGGHSFVHSYYHIGTAPIVALLLWDGVRLLARRGRESSRAHEGRAGLPTVVSILGLLLLLPHFFGIVHSEFRSLLPGHARRYVWSGEFLELRSRNPDLPWGRGYVFRSPKFPVYPRIGTGFGEREGSMTAEFGFSARGARWPEECRRVDESAHLVLVRCAAGSGRP